MTGNNIGQVWEISLLGLLWNGQLRNRAVNTAHMILFRRKITVSNNLAISMTLNHDVFTFLREIFQC